MRVILIDDGMPVLGELTDHLRKLMLVDLVILRQQYRDAGWALVRPEEALETFLESDMALVVLPGDRLMMVSAGRPWFSPDIILSEEWLGHGVTVPEAVEVMKAIGRAHGIERFEVGTRATPGQRHEAAARLYQRQGLRLSTCVLEGKTHE